MMERLMRRVKRQKRKVQHVKFLHQMIVERHSEIVIAALNNTIAKNKAILLKKYNRRLKLILF